MHFCKNEQLTKEQKEHIRNLYNLAKGQEKDLERKELISIEQVEQAMKHKMELSKQNERKLNGIGCLMFFKTFFISA